MKNENTLICENLSINSDGHLTFGGQDVTVLAEKYGTPLYLMDEDRITNRVRTYLDAMKRNFGERCEVMYAGKAACFKAIYGIMKRENMNIDVVSAGEIETARSAGFPMKKAYFHSATKTDQDINFAMQNGVGQIVVDSEEELLAIDEIAGHNGIIQNVLIRITPGIDPHTFAAVTTGKVDSKFGFSIETGLAEAILKTAISLKNIRLCGLHCHVGSQIFDSRVYIDSASIMLDFIAYAKEKYAIEIEKLDLGGGYGVRYLPEHPEIDIAANIDELAAFIKKKCENIGMAVPVIGLEPGRSIVADAGLTVYTIGSVKKIPGFVNYVLVDGGMTDNVRYAMYKAPYTVVCPAYMNEEWTMKSTVAGRCCESGDIIQPEVKLYDGLKRGDYLAVLTTGAYNYSMASNYNRIPRPPVVMLKGGEPYIAVRRETVKDIIMLDE